MWEGIRLNTTYIFPHMHLENHRQFNMLAYRYRKNGFTLLELLIVVAILAIIGGSIIVTLDNTQESATVSVAQDEIVKIRQALERFKRDTGYYPKQGPFALAPDGGYTSSGQGGVLRTSLPFDGTVAEEDDWFDSPANFWQLYEQPVLDDGVETDLHPLSHLQDYNPVTKRGWNGPYLSTLGNGLVDIGNNIDPDGTGNPEAGDLLSEVYGISDPFTGPPEGNVYAWRSAAQSLCETQYGVGSPECDPYPSYGRPFLIFGLDTVDDTTDDRIVSMGPNQTYAGLPTDICFPNTGVDDIILCVER